MARWMKELGWEASTKNFCQAFSEYLRLCYLIFLFIHSSKAATEFFFTVSLKKIVQVRLALKCPPTDATTPAR